jgi:hypothetical protein
MFKIDNYRISYSYNKIENIIYLKMYDCATYDTYKCIIDIYVLNEDIKYIPKMDDLLNVFNTIFKDKKDNLKIILGTNKVELIFNIQNLLFNINFSLILNKECRDKETDIITLKETIYLLEKKVEKLKHMKHNKYNYELNCKFHFKPDQYYKYYNEQKYQINCKNKYLYISLNDEYIIPLIDKYIKIYLKLNYCFVENLILKSTTGIFEKELGNGNAIYQCGYNNIRCDLNIKHNLKHLILYNCGIMDSCYPIFESLKIKIFEITNDKSPEHLYILNNLKKTNIHKLILRNCLIPTGIFTKYTFIPKLKEIELYNCKSYEHIKEWADIYLIKLYIM